MRDAVRAGVIHPFTNGASDVPPRRFRWQALPSGQRLQFRDSFGK
jgi:hypothetical protein